MNINLQIDNITDFVKISKIIKHPIYLDLIESSDDKNLDIIIKEILQPSDLPSLEYILQNNIYPYQLYHLLHVLFNKSYKYKITDNSIRPIEIILKKMLQEYEGLNFEEWDNHDSKRFFEMAGKSSIIAEYLAKLFTEIGDYNQDIYHLLKDYENDKNKLFLPIAAKMSLENYKEMILYFNFDEKEEEEFLNIYTKAQRELAANIVLDNAIALRNSGLPPYVVENIISFANNTSALSLYESMKIIAPILRNKPPGIMSASALKYDDVQYNDTI